MALELRSYQQECVDTVWKKLFEKQHILVVLSPGAGKTEIAIELCRRAIEKKSDIKILFVIDKVLLVDQTVKRFKQQIVSTGAYCASLNEYDLVNNVTVASVQSIHKSDVGKVDFLLIDETHKLINRDDSHYGKLLNLLKLKNEKLKVLGLTATPFRATGYIYGEGEFFSEIDYEKDFQWMIDNKYLVAPKMKKPHHQFDTKGIKIVAGDFDSAALDKLAEDRDKLAQQILDAMPRLEGRKKIVWMCINIEHSESVKTAIPENAAIIHSKMTMSEREEQMRKFRGTACRHLVFVTIIAEGVDIPEIDAIVMLRPTRSPTRYVQAVGRALRLYPSKEDALILDYGRVVENCGPLDNPRIRKKGERKADTEILVKTCPECLEYINLKIMVCPACGYTFPVNKPKPLKVVDKNLTATADGAGGLLMREARLIEISDVSVGKHMSKAGNECLKITYFPKNFMLEPISEFFVVENKFVYQRAISRLAQFGMVPNQSGKPAKIPVAITMRYENKYPRVIDLFFEVNP